MEVELTCLVCKKHFTNPIMLPCSHSVCLGCAESITTTTDEIQSQNGGKDDNYVTLCEINHAREHMYQAIENLSCIQCPTCKKRFPLDDKGVSNFPGNKLLENIVNRFYSKPSGNLYCQLCEGNSPAKATVMCEQCEVVYCDKCCKICHPSRGPLAKHSLISPSSNVSVRHTVIKCGEHREENISMYCVTCRNPVCYLCLERGSHKGHDVKALGAMFKKQKEELAGSINSLKEKILELQTFIQRLHSSCAIIQENGLDFEASIVAQCDALIQVVEQRKSELIDAISQEVHRKIEKVQTQIKESEKTLKGKVGLLDYCTESLKENDPASFLLVSNSLNSRVINTCQQWNEEMKLKPSTEVELDLTLDTSAARQALHDLNFSQLKAPSPPEIVPDLCSVSSNTITLSWKSRKQSCVEGYIVEIDDGGGGKFVEVYSGKSHECSVAGLQFDSTYRARVKSYNKAGQGTPSDEIYLTTSEVAWFALDPKTAHPDIMLTNGNATCTCTSFDDRVVLGDIGFARGKHYWEITIDRYDGNPDPAMGVAYNDTVKESILGKDNKAWCMYIDSSRSWFRHNNEHSNRREGGVEVGSVIGILLDVTNHKVSFYLNDEKKGSIRLPSLDKPLYPAFSINRKLQITLHTGLDPPDNTQYGSRA